MEICSVAERKPYFACNDEACSEQITNLNCQEAEIGFQNAGFKVIRIVVVEAQNCSSLGHSFTEQSTESTYLMTEATCTTDAVYYYKCSRCSEKGTETWTKTGSAGHDYGSPQWTWNDNGKSASCSLTCKRSTCASSATGHSLSASVTYGNGITSKVKTPATCVTNGTTTYTATTTLNSKPYTSTKDVQDIIASGSHAFPASYTNGIKECSACHLAAYQPLGSAVSGWYSITNAGQLVSFSQMVTAAPNVEYKARLTHDIDMSAVTTYAPICYATSTTNLSYDNANKPQKGFLGTFDGQGHTISNLTIAKNSAQISAGLFGNNSGTICNLGIVNFSYDQNDYDGRFAAVAGVNFGTIQNCYVTRSTVKSSSHICGAITGGNYGGTIRDSYELGNTIGTHGRSGHMVGDANNDGGSLKGVITNCYSDDKLGNENQTGYPGGGQTGGRYVAASRFASGDICYRLNGSTSTGTLTWAQNLETQSYPVPTGGGVRYDRQMSYQWGTLVLPFAINYSQSNGNYKLYYLSSANSGNLTFTEYANGDIPAGTPMAVKAVGDKDSQTGKYTISFTPNGAIKTTITATSSVDGLTMNGTYEKKENQTGIYFIAQDKFWRADAAITIAPFRAWFEGTPTTGVKEFNIVVDDETDGINDIVNGKLSNCKFIDNGRIVIRRNGKKYNVNGQVIR